MGVLFWEEAVYFGSILAAPDFGKLAHSFADRQTKRGIIKEGEII